MKKIPSQFYIFVMLLLLYFWPQSLSFHDSLAGDIFTAIFLSHAFVMACNILVSESWKYAIILIEAFCIMFNVTLFLAPDILSKFHAQVMISALIIELLIITISLHGVAIGRSNSCRIPLAIPGLWALRRHSLRSYSDSQVEK